MVETEAPVLWPPDGKSCLAGKKPDVGRDGRQKEKRVAEDETAGWYYQLSGHEFAQIAGAGRRKRSLACCSPPGHRVTRVTQGLNITEAKLSDHKQSLQEIVTWSDHSSERPRHRVPLRVADPSLPLLSDHVRTPCRPWQRRPPPPSMARPFLCPWTTARVLHGPALGDRDLSTSSSTTDRLHSQTP